MCVSVCGFQSVLCFLAVKCRDLDLRVSVRSPVAIIALAISATLMLVVLALAAVLLCKYIHVSGQGFI